MNTDCVCSIKHAILNDGSLAMGHKMWHVCFCGLFAFQDWDLQLLNEYMTQNQLDYLEWSADRPKINPKRKGMHSKIDKLR